jgi:hypothetical protein
VAYVYWIRAPHHTDMLKEGYIGVTSSDVATRFYFHRAEAKAGSTKPVHHAIRKYADALIVTPLVQADEAYCYELEARLRPAVKVGWNLAIGGLSSPMRGITGEQHPNFGKPCSEATKQKISRANAGQKNGNFGKTGSMNAFHGRKHSEAAREKMRAARTRRKEKDAQTAQTIAID